MNVEDLARLMMLIRESEQGNVSSEFVQMEKRVAYGGYTPSVPELAEVLSSGGRGSYVAELEAQINYLEDILIQVNRLTQG